MREFHARGKLCGHLGATFITLTAKNSGATCIEDFHPISLIGSIYKILAKVLATRLQKVLPNLITINQGAFVKGRQILDGVLIANEFIHSRNLEKKPGLICKLGLEKAYDMVDWDFLQYLICQMGFGQRRRTWIMECLQLAHYSILVNDSPKDFFLGCYGGRGDESYD
eukprot:TRINITY_DN6958_c1_g1_i1.p1 TRINITY_DN6958_c1_g1~~TRINITY_DN6958_c1_g1_i1.p1  ORF type:complete len:168 (+),score=22.95 TRINITY_DN6958_c1_g1_i1:1084-1587(+)